MQTTVRPHSKLPDVGTTIFTVIGQLAAEYQAINLSQGAPNFPCDARLVENTHAAMRAGHNQYAPMAGLMSLREALAQKMADLYGAAYDPASEITVTASASEGLYAAISALVHPGDEVIYFEPAFDSYAPIVRLQGATPVAIRLQAPDYAIPWDEVAAKINPRTRMILINTPHNPTATVLGDDDIAQLSRLTAGTDIVILSDEVYEHIVFDGMPHHGMAAYPALAERSVIVSSFGKTFHVTGWRIGYCAAPAALMDEIRKVHQFMVFSADTPMQHAFVEQLKNPASYLGLSELYQQKRDLLARLLAESRFELLPSKGSFFMLARYGHFSDEPDSQFVQRLIRDFGVATIPLSAFYSDGTDARVVRLSFAKDDATLRAGAERLCQV